MLDKTVISENELTAAARFRFIEKGTTLAYAKNKVYSQIENSGSSRLLIRSKDGFEGYINKNSVDKMLSAIDKYEGSDITPAQHYAAVADIVSLYESSVKILTHPDKKGSYNIEAIDRFVAPLYGDRYAFITGKRIIDNGRKIHSIELMELGKLEENLTELKSASATNYP